MKSIAERILEICAEGPATAEEIGLEFPMTRHRLNANLCDLYRRGKLTRRPYYLPDTSRANVRDHVWIYALPDYQQERAA